MTIPRLDNIASETGQTMTEYAVVLSLIVLVTLVAFTQLGDRVQGAVEAARSLFP